MPLIYIPPGLAGYLEDSVLTLSPPPGEKKLSGARPACSAVGWHKAVELAEFGHGCFRQTSSELVSGVVFARDMFNSEIATCTTVA